MIRKYCWFTQETNMIVVGYCDFDREVNVGNRKDTSGGDYYLCSNLGLPFSRNYVSLPTTEMKYIVVKVIKSIIQMLVDYGCRQKMLQLVLINSTVDITKNPI